MTPLFPLLLLGLPVASSSLLTGENLWDGAADIHKMILASPFISQACSGELDAEHFGQYMVQDIGCFMPKAIEVLHGLHQRSAREQGVHGNLTVYFAQMRAAYATYLSHEGRGWDLGSVNCSISRQAYVNFLSDVAENKPLEQSVISFSPCTVLWEWLGWKMSSCTLTKNAYRAWITGLQSGKASTPVHQIDITTYPVQQSVETFRAAMMHEFHVLNSAMPTAATLVAASAPDPSNNGLGLWSALVPASLMAMAFAACMRSVACRGKVEVERLQRLLLEPTV